MRFGLAYSPAWRVVLALLGMGPQRSWLDLDDQELVLRMGWAFSARLPRASIASAVRGPKRRLSIGVHGWRGDWLVNGSSHNLVTFQIHPPVPARAVGFQIRLHRLTVSLENPEAFLARLAAT